ncbi:hypothetical protein ACHAWF_006871 [Thalassiosira exigua]
MVSYLDPQQTQSDRSDADGSERARPPTPRPSTAAAATATATATATASLYVLLCPLASLGSPLRLPPSFRLSARFLISLFSPVVIAFLGSFGIRVTAATYDFCLDTVAQVFI